MPHAPASLRPVSVPSLTAATSLRGFGRLVVGGVLGVTDLVEEMHRNIASPGSLVGRTPRGGARGVAGLVYSSVRAITRGVGFGLDQSLRAAEALEAGPSSPERLEILRAALNAAFGDLLEASGNPLAVPMTLRRGDGRVMAAIRSRVDLASGSPAPLSGSDPGRILLLIHGLGLRYRSWQRSGLDYGEQLRHEHGWTPLYLDYNTGRGIATNGGELATLLEGLIESWPVPVREVALVGHSMGGLVARSACHHGRAQDWVSRLSALITLGTPHLGAPLEQAGYWLERGLGLTPYSAPFVRLARARSRGVQDLRRGVELGTDADPLDPPDADRLFALAACRSEKGGEGAVGAALGDGLVPVASALGLHSDPARGLDLLAGRRSVLPGLDHFDLLAHPRVSARLVEWLGE